MGTFAVALVGEALGRPRAPIRGRHRPRDTGPAVAAGFDLLYCGNFVDLGFYDAQETVNARHWIFPGELAAESMQRTAERAPGAEAIVVNGMPNFRRADGLPQRIASLQTELETLVGMPVVSSDTALYWRIFKSLGLAPTGTHGRPFSTLAPW